MRRCSGRAPLLAWFLAISSAIPSARGAAQAEPGPPPAPTCDPFLMEPGARSPCSLVAVTRARRDARCARERAGVVCEVRLEVVLRSTADHALEIPLGALVARPYLSTTTVDDRPLEAEVIELAPGLERRVVIEQRARGRLRPPGENPFQVLDDLAKIEPLTVRHPLFADAPRARTQRRAELELAPGSWSDRGRWAAHHLEEPVLELGPGLGTAVHVQDRAVIVERGSDVVLANGGPVIAVGGTADFGARVLAGYEVGLSEGWTSLIGALTADLVTDGARVQGTLAATIELATPSSWWVLPSVSIGVGPAIVIADSARFAIRTLATLAWPIGIVAVLDVLPDEPRVDLTLLGRISL